MTERPNDPARSAAPPDGASDPERLAALLDGRLNEADRGALLAHLVDDDDDLALFAEAAAIQRELEAEDGGTDEGDAEAPDPAAPEPGVIPFRRPARPARVLDRRWLAAAAMVAGVALAPVAWRASQGGSVRAPSHAVALLENPSAGLPPGWNSVWTPTRGAGEVVTEEGRPVRLGAYGVQLEVAVRARDAERTRGMADRIRALLADAPVGTYASSRFDAIVERPDAPAAELLPILEEANRAAADVVDPDRYALGAWAEAARLAVARRDAAFFREGRTRRTLKSAEALVGDDEAARTALSAIRAASDSGAPDWASLGKNVDQLLAAIGR